MVIPFPTVFPVRLVDAGGLVIALILLVLLYFQFRGWMPALRAKYFSTRIEFQFGLKSLIREYVYQRDLVSCNKPFWVAHLAVFWGFLLLTLSTIMDDIFNRSGAPLPLNSPIRISGNVGGVMLVGGLAYIIIRRVYDWRIRRDTKLGNTVFLGLLLLAGVTGFATEFTAYSNSYLSLYLVYAIHLLFVSVLLAFAPITKFAHAIGRPVLILFERSRAQERTDNKKNN
jgi:nitrate reductase gamma subunit